MQSVLFVVLTLQSTFALVLRAKENAKENVTNPGIMCTKSDGFGALLTCKLAAFATARHDGSCYAHVDFYTGAFHANGKYMDAEKLTGMHADEGCKQKGAKNIGNDGIFKIQKEGLDNYYTDEVRDELNRNFYADGKKPLNTSCEVVFHVRRGDVAKDHNGNRFTPNNVIQDAMERNFKGKKICIYSEGLPKDFGTIQNVPNVTFHLNDSVEDTFQALVEAKHLVIAKSSFSYDAGIFNRNNVYFISRFWHTMLADWKQVDLGVSFARANPADLVLVPKEGGVVSDYD